MQKDRLVLQLGGPNRGAGDPGPLAVGAGSEIAIALSGVNEIAIGNAEKGAWQRVPIGRRPSAVAMTDSGLAFVAETFSDSVSVVDVNQAKRVGQIPLGPSPELTAAQRGEMLFFDARLAHDGWMSCHSCHTDGHTNGQLNDNLSDGSFGAPKRVLSLLGVGQTGPWAWNGETKTLQQQARNSIQKTMQGKPVSEDQIAAIVAYMKTLSAPVALAGDLGSEKTAAIRHGQQLFRALECNRCHAPPTYTSADTYDVDMKDAVGNRQFNPPSLRGIRQRTSFFHDSRASSLIEVLAVHQHQLSRELSELELNSLLQFLRSI